MKRKMWIVMALAAMILALCSGGALAAERRISGTVNVSTLPDFCSVILTDDTTLVVDADKTLESIYGESHSLTIQGSHDLSFVSDYESIYVGTLTCNMSGGKIIVLDMNLAETHHWLGGYHDVAIDAKYGVVINNEVVIHVPSSFGNHHSGIGSEYGNVTINGNVNILGESGMYCLWTRNGDITITGEVTSNKIIRSGNNVEMIGGKITHCLSIEAEQGDAILNGEVVDVGFIGVDQGYLSLSGNIEVTTSVYVHDNIELLSGKLYAGAIKSYNGNIALNGEVHTKGIRAMEGSINMQGQIEIKYGERNGHDDLDDAELSCIYAKNEIVFESGSLTVEGINGLLAGGNVRLSGTKSITSKAMTVYKQSFAPGFGITSQNGDVTLSGTTKVYGNNGVEALNGMVYLYGNLEVGVVSTSGEYAINAKYGIKSDCASIVKNGPFYGLNGYYYVTQFLPTSGTGTMPPKMCWQGAQITLPGCLFDAPENFEFMGWHNASHSTLHPGDPVTINSDTNFFAQWQRIPRTVTFSPGSGSGTMASLTVGQGEQLTLPACTFNPPSLLGVIYSFDRWKIGTSLYNPGSKVTITGNTTVTATWKSDKMTITFLSNGGTGSMVPMFRSKGDTFVLPENEYTPPAGQAFVYWNVISTGYRSPGAVITVLRDLTIQPVWQAAKIYFDANGGSGTMDPVVVQASWNGVYTLPACAFTPPANMIFAGWQIGDLIHMAGETWPIYGDKVAKAVWTDKMYTVSFIHGSDSSGTMRPVQVTSGSVYTFPACTFTPPSGKVFQGWLLSGKVYHQGETVTVTGNMQLYAEWQENPNNVYTLTFDGNGLAGSMSSISVKSGETITLPECMFEVPETKRFRYWRVTGEINGKSPGTTVTMTGNKTATADYVDRPLRTVTFKTNGLYKGELPAARQVYDGYSVDDPGSLQMDGYIFLGWFTGLTTNEASRWDFSDPVTSDLNLYCGWQSAPPVAHPISITTNGHGTAIAYDAYEGGNEISEATKNTWVYVTVTPDPGYEQQYGGLDWTTASGQSGYASLNRFTMPDEAVAVSVIFRPVRVNFILPASLTSIEDEAFSGIAATAVVIPGSVTSITGNPFAGIDTLTIYGYPGSAAETFANRIPGYTFIPIDDEWMEGQK